MSPKSNPLSFRVVVNRLPSKGMPLRIEADEAQRAALAAAHDLRAVHSFVADLTVRPWKRDGVRVDGAVCADIVQTCVVTLEPLPARIDSPVSALFVPEGSPLARVDEGGEMILDAGAEDLPETFDGNAIDVGTLAEEFFTLSLDPYPRKPGAEPLQPRDGDEDGEPAEGTLSAQLRKLRAR